MADHDFDEFADYAAPAAAAPSAAAHDLGEFDEFAPAATKAPAPLPRQTGKRFIEPPDDDEPAGPTLQEQQMAALGVAPSNRHKTFPSSNELIDQVSALKGALARRPELPERVIRNINQGLPLVGPYSDEINAALTAPFRSPSIGKIPETYRHIRDTERARDAEVLADAPTESFLTRTAAGLAPAGALFKGAATAGQMAMRAFGLGAVEGAGRSEHDLTKGDVAGVVNDAGFSGAVNALTQGAISKLVRGAPERVDDRMLESISRGEGGKVSKKLTSKLAAKAGDSDEPVGVLNEVLARFPGLKRILATSAASAPRKAAAEVEDRIAVAGAKLRPIYDTIDAAGGTKLIDVVSSTDKLRRDALAEGRMGVAEAIDRWREATIRNFGTDGKVPDTTRLTGTMLRNLRNEIGNVAFGPDPAAQNTPVAIMAKQRIYGALNGAIEKAGAAAGVDVAKLRNLNRDVSMLLAVKAPLETRGLNATGGGKTLQEILLHTMGPAALAGAGFGAHGTEGAASGAALALGALAARKILGPAVRGTDYQLGRMVEAARAGSTPAQLGQFALELGLSREVGDAIADKLSRTVLPPVDEPSAAP